MIAAAIEYIEYDYVEKGRKYRLPIDLLEGGSGGRTLFFSFWCALNDRCGH
jgi:hypothetical protein